MSGGTNRLLFATRAGMEVCWRYAWAQYASTGLLERTFPLLQATGAFLAAALLSAFCRGRGWRRGRVLALQALGLGAATLMMVHALEGISRPWWDLGWVSVYLQEPRDFVEGLFLALVLFWAVAFWVGGASLGRRSADYLQVCSRFDVGVAAFLALFLVRWLVEDRADLETASTEYLLYPFFVFGLFSVGLARNRGGGRREFFEAYRGLGLVLTGLSGAVLLGTAVATLFLSQLKTAAQAGYVVLRAVAAPFGPVLLRVLRFLLVGRPVDTGGTSGGGGGAGHDLALTGGGGGWQGILEEVLTWGLVALIGGLALLFGALVLWALGRWLLSRTPGGRRTGLGTPGFVRWLAEAWIRLRAVVGGIRVRRRQPPNAARIYRALRRWGARSGLMPVPVETPQEFGLRLQRRFPAGREAFEQIVGLFHEEVYGEQPLTAERLSQGRRAFAGLGRTRFWPSRVRSWLLRRDPV